MATDRSKNPKAPFKTQAFWQEVERDAQADQIDWYDLAMFMSADELPVEPSPEFVDDLRERLREHVRRLYAS